MKNSKTKGNEFYKMVGTRDMYNGTSFKMNKWEPNTFYANDDNIIDFVSYENCLLFCIRNHWSEESNAPIIIYDDDQNIVGIEPNPFWEFVHSRGLTGKTGQTGPIGPIGPKGDPGTIEGSLSVNVSAKQADIPSAESKLENNLLSIEFGIPKGEDGLTPTFKIEDGRWFISYNGINWEDIGQATGESGKDGIDGKDGKDGISPNTSFKSIVFCRTNSIPDTPSGGSYSDAIPAGWSDGIPSGEEQIWMSTRIFTSDGQSPQQDSWTMPQSISDTASFDVEFSDLENPGTPNTHPNNWSNTASEQTIWMATRTYSNGVWTNWQISKIKGETGESGKGIATVNVYFGISTSSTVQPTQWEDDASKLNITPNDWLWSKTVTTYTDESSTESIVCISKNGADGNGILKIDELFYLHTSWDTIPDNVEWSSERPAIIPGKYVWVKLRITYNDGTEKIVGPYCSTGIKGEQGQDGPGIEYVFLLSSDSTLTEEINKITSLSASQVDNYIPKDLNWSDNILETSEQNQYLWVSVRRRKNGMWGTFETPVIWSRYVKDGEPGVQGAHMFTAFAFTRTNTNISDVQPVGGSYISPKPESDSIIWYDSIPEGEEMLWMTSCVFSNEAQYDGVWTSPQRWFDTKDFQVEYSSKDTPNAPSLFTGDESSWRNENPDWNDNVTEAIWMITASMHNGEWSEWKQFRIKGEKGQDGTSVKIKGSFNTVEELEIAFPNGPENDDYCYLVGEYLYVWDSSSWVSVGQIKGADGQSAYVHIKYATLTDGVYVFTDPDSENPGEVVGPYIGICANEYPQDPTDIDSYSWSKWEGKDGWGYEYIYCLTADNVKPSIPTSISSEGGVDGIYTWTDNPGDVSIDYPYCWMVWKHSDQTQWNGKDGYATLFAKYGKDGLTGPQGTQGKTIYPAGEFAIDKLYQSTETSVPYVIDGSDYYVLTASYYQSGIKPSEDTSGSWMKMDQFNAVYANIGIIDNGKFGSAVFNGDYMFSQQGSGNYQDFNAEDPFNESNTFKPNYCVNFNTGEMWASQGLVNFKSDGSGYLAGGKIKWDSDGTIHTPITGLIEAHYTDDGVNILSLEYTITLMASIYNETQSIKVYLMKDGLESSIVVDEFESVIPAKYTVKKQTMTTWPNKLSLYVNDELISELNITVPEVSTRQCKLTLKNTDDTTSGITYQLKGYEIFDTVISKAQFVEYYSSLSMNMLPTMPNWNTNRDWIIINYLIVKDSNFNEKNIIIPDTLSMDAKPNAYIYTVSKTTNFTEDDVKITPIFLLDSSSSIHGITISLPGEYFNSSDTSLT